MYEEVLNFNGIDYIVKITRKARVEIEEVSKKNSNVVANDQDTIEA